METDFLDDPRRPGAVLGPKTIPKRTQELCRALLEFGKTESEVSQIMMDIHSNWPTKLYS
jgi:TatD-related deoxyribonuclease